MRLPVLGSIALHSLILLFTIFSLPLFNDSKIDTPPIIQIELIEIAKVTNIPEKSVQKSVKEKNNEKEKKEEKINRPISKPKDEKSNQKTEEAEDNINKVEKKIEKKMIENVPIRKPQIKKKDTFDPLKLAELIDKQKDTKTNIEDIPEKDIEVLDSKPSLNKRLTLSEEDAIRAQFMQCWSIPLGIPFDDTMIVKIKILLNTDGSLQKPPEVIQHERMNKPSEKYFRTLAESALRAVRRCDPIKVPEVERYESWKSLQLNFDPREILRG
tara:strand:+ start:310 stop:1119 length:810 start_codon:yes stop_codon:yes gene_type:complete